MLIALLAFTLLLVVFSTLGVAANYFNPAIANIGLALFNLNGDTFKLALFTAATAPTTSDGTYSGSSNTLNSSGAAEVANGNGYTAGGATVGSTAYSQTSGTGTFTGTPASPTWTASGAGFSLRYVALYDSTTGTSSTRPLLLWWDYGSTLTLASGNTFTVTYSSNQILTITHS